MAANWLSRMFQPRSAPVVRPALTASTITTDGAGDAALEARMDMFSNAVTGLGRHNSKTSCNRWDLQWGRSSWVLENFFTFNPLASRIITLEPRLALKKGFLIPQLDEEDQVRLDDFNRRRSFLSKYGQARVWERQFGGAILFMDIQDGGELDEPVDINRIESVGQLTPIDRHDLAIREFINDPLTGDMATPDFYEIHGSRVFRRIHRSRVLEFRGIPTTTREIIRNQGWGGGELDRVFKAIERYDTTRSYLAEAITRLTQGVLTSPELANAGKSEKSGNAKSRYNKLGQDMGLLGDIVLQEGETYQVIQRSIQGFLDASEISRSEVVAASGIPDSILFGETKGGLSSGENTGDWKVVANDVAGVQTSDYTPKVSKYLRYVFASRQSPIKVFPERWDINWPQILEVTASERAQIILSTSEAAATLTTNGVITPDEARTNKQIVNNFVLGDIDPEDQGQLTSLVVAKSSEPLLDAAE